MAREMPFPCAKFFDSANRGCMSRSNIAHTESRAASASRFSFLDSSIARSTTARGIANTTNRN